MNNTKQICGLPGFGSPGLTGELGEHGASFHIIDASISDVSTLNNTLMQSKYKENDIFIYNNDLFLIDTKQLNNNTLLSYTKICNNPLSIIRDNENDINITVPILLHDSIKTKNQLDNINVTSPITIVSDSSNFINFIDSSNNEMSFIKYNGLDGFNIGNETNITAINNLYIDDSVTNILSEKYGISELNRLISSCTFVNDRYVFKYKVNNNAKYRVTAIKREHSNNDTLDENHNVTLENILIDFNDTDKSFAISNDDIFYKVYYINNINDKENNIITQIFNHNNKTSKLKNAYINSDNALDDSYNILIDKNNISIFNTNEFDLSDGNDIESVLVLEFTNNSNVDITYDPHNLSIATDNNKVILKIPEEYNKLYSIGIGYVNYNISISNYIKENETDELEFIFREDKSGYLGCNSAFHGVPLNGILQVYTLDFIKFDDSDEYTFNFKIKSSLDNSTNLTLNDCSIYYKVVTMNNRIPIGIDNDTYVYLKDLKDASCEYIDFSINNENVNEYNISFAKNTLNVYNPDNNLQSNKLVIYYEFNDPFYGILKTDISGKINDLDFDTISKSTLMIPWEIIGFVPKQMEGPAQYNLSIKNVIKSYNNGVYPLNMKTLSIIPSVNNKYMAMHTFDKYKYCNTNTIIINNIKYNVNAYTSIFANDSFLEIAYDYRQFGTISYINTLLGEVKHASGLQFAQCTNKLPIWIKSNFNIKIDGSIYEYDSDIIVPTGTIYSPQNADDYMVDLVPPTKRGYLSYKDYLKGNLFVGFVEWSIHKNFTTNKNGKITSSIIKHPFSNINDLLLNPNNTLYSLYWHVNPRIVKATPAEISYDYAINMLKQPKVCIGNNKVAINYVKHDNNVQDVFNSMTYSNPYTVVDSSFKYNDTIKDDYITLK